MYEREGTSRYNIRKNHFITGLRFEVGPKLDPENDTKGQIRFQNTRYCWTYCTQMQI